MARKMSKKDNRHLAKLVTGERGHCAFCLREVDDEITYGKLYAIGDIQCHYYCCLLSCCLIQKGHDEEGLFGFMYTDILAEVERCKKHKCSYCGRSGANLGCSVGVCRKQFHVPCGRDKNAVSLYYGSYKSFCQQHAPKQKIPEHIMAKARLRLKMYRAKGNTTNIQNTDVEVSEETICLICYEAVEGFPTVNTFWPPCCGKDAWFHRTCLQRMALSAGMHYLKCPLCNDKEHFYDAVMNQGYYVPDRDAAWELEQNAFAEIYERPTTCSAESCLCPLGRSHDAENGKWDIKLCLLCGSAGAHAQCIADQSQPPKPDTVSLDQSETTQASTVDHSEKIIEATTLTDQSEAKEEKNSCIEANGLRKEDVLSMGQLNISSDKSNTSPAKSNTSVRFVCRSCLPAAPQDLDSLASSIDAIIQQEQAQSTTETRRPVMPSRMSIRRTKGRRAIMDRPSTSRSNRIEAVNGLSESPNIVWSRLDLNLKSPRRLQGETIPRETSMDNKLLSPLKLLEQTFREKMVYTGVREAVLDEALVDTLRQQFRKPRPLCERKRILNRILDGIFEDLLKDSKEKEKAKKWCSPQKCYDSMKDSKEQHDDLSDSLNELQSGQNKENDSNTPNTPLKDPRNNKIEDTISNLIITDEIIKNNSIKYQKDDDDVKNINISLNLINRNKYIENHVTEEQNNENDLKNIDVKQNDIKTDETTAVSEQNDIKIEETSEQNGTEQFSLSTIGTDIQSDTEELTRKNIEIEMKINPTSESNVRMDENCQNNTNAIIIWDTPPRSSNKCCKTPKNPIQILFRSSDGNENNNRKVTEDKIEDTSTEISKESERKIEKSISESPITQNNNIIEVDDSTTNTPKDDSENFQIKFPNEINKFTKKPLSLKRRHSNKNKRKSPKGVEKSKHITSKNNSYKDKQKIRSKSESSSDINILKRLITEKDLCSQLLLELTTGKVNNKNINNSSCSENQKIINNVQITSNETPKLTNDISKSLCVTPEHKTTKNSDETPKSNESTKDSNETPKSSQNASKRTSKTRKDSKVTTKSLKSTKDSLRNLQKDLDLKTFSSKDSNETPKLSSENHNQCLTDTPIDLEKTPNTLIDIPKHKTIDIQQDSSLEISENDQHVNIDVIRIEDSPTTNDSYKKLQANMPDQLKTCFKFSPKEGSLDKNDTGIDLESFKKEYLSEVDRAFQCSFKHKHIERASRERTFCSPIDFAIDAAIKKDDSGSTNKKRKLSESGVKLVFGDNDVKRRRTSESDLKLVYNYEKNTPECSKDFDKMSVEDNEAKKKANKDKRRKKEEKARSKAKRNKRRSSSNKNIEVTIDSSEKRSIKNKRIKKKIKTKFQIKNQNIKVKIQWKKKQLSLNIESKKDKKNKKNLDNHSKFKQYVLQFPEGSSKEVLVRPEKEVCPMKKKYSKNEKSPDKLKQMSIESFFKLKSEK